MNNKQPVLFIGHGHPINAIDKNNFTEALENFGASLQKPKAILVVSAHWETNGTYVSTSENPETIYDFGNFHPDLFKIRYLADGSPEFAAETIKAEGEYVVKPDRGMGLDHGAWTILKYLFPKADVPVFQLSLDYTKPPEYHYELGKNLSKLREKGLLIIGSGNIVHNLKTVSWFERDAKTPDWAIDFDATAKKYLLENEYKKLINYNTLGEAAKASIPTNEHYLPMLYSLALREKNEQLKFIFEGFQYGSISMRAFMISDE